MWRVQVDKRGSQRRERGAGGDPLGDAGGDETGDITRGQEEDERGRLERDRSGQHRAATDVI
jgi:hypothetical protein